MSILRAVSLVALTVLCSTTTLTKAFVIPSQQAFRSSAVQQQSSTAAATTTVATRIQMAMGNSENDDEAPTKKKKKKSPPPAPAAAPIDISKLDIRVGVITKAWEHEEADKLYCELIDIGEEDGPRQIASGLREHYDLEDLKSQRVLVLSNLKTRKLMGFPSHGMVLCAASGADEGSLKVEFVEPPTEAKIGERISVEGYEGEPATENQVIKKKMLDAIFPDLKTNAEGVATYKGLPFTTSAGPCKAGLSNADVA